MALIRVTSRSGAPDETAADTRVVPLFDGETLDDPALQALVELGEAKPGLRKVAVTHEDAPGGGRRRVLIAGLGKRDELDAERAREAGRARWPDGPGSSAPCPSPGPCPAATAWTAAWWRARSCASTPSSASSPSATTTPAAASSRSSWWAIRWTTPSSSSPACRPSPPTPPRDLQNLPANVATPSFLADRAVEIAADHDSLEVEILDRDAIESRGMGALRRGGPGHPRRAAADRDALPGARRHGPHLGFVGKAVTFDTGGISIKPAAKMQEMKFDMSGRRRGDRGDGRDRRARAAARRSPPWCPPPRTCRAAPR